MTLPPTGRHVLFYLDVGEHGSTWVFPNDWWIHSYNSRKGTPGIKGDNWFTAFRIADPYTDKSKSTFSDCADSLAYEFVEWVDSTWDGAPVRNSNIPPTRLFVDFRNGAWKITGGVKEAEFIFYTKDTVAIDTLRIIGSGFFGNEKRKFLKKSKDSFVVNGHSVSMVEINMAIEPCIGKREFHDSGLCVDVEFLRKYPRSGLDMYLRAWGNKYTRRVLGFPESCEDYLDYLKTHAP